MESRHMTIVKAAGFMLVWTVILFTLAAAVYGIAGDGDLLAREMFRHAPPEVTGLPETEYEGAGRMTAGYLTGREPVFQYAFSDAEGREYTCFQPHEADHMADCRNLIGLAGTLRWIIGCLALLFAAAGVLLRKHKAFSGGMFTGLGTAALVFAGLAGWALADFDGLFVTFHRVAFTNEGWLLDPRTDLLIRLMPTGLFIALAVKIMVWTAAAALMLLAAAVLIRNCKAERQRNA